MKLLITGATGFIGRYFVPAILMYKNTETALIITRNIDKSKQLFTHSKCKFCQIEDIKLISEFNPDIVIHLAAKLTSSNNSDVIDDLIDSNIKFGIKLLDTLKNCSNLKLFINFGTFAEYRLGPDKVNNAYLYSATKTAFRTFLDYYSELSGYKYIHVVPYTIYGGIDSSKKIMDYITDSFNSQSPIKMSGGEQVLDFIHIKDVVRFLKFIIENKSKWKKIPSGETIHLGTGKGTSIQMLSKIMEKKYGSKCNIAWGTLPYRERDVMYAVAPIGKLLILGWKPKIKL